MANKTDFNKLAEQATKMQKAIDKAYYKLLKENGFESLEDAEGSEIYELLCGLQCAASGLESVKEQVYQF